MDRGVGAGCENWRGLCGFCKCLITLLEHTVSTNILTYIACRFGPLISEYAMYVGMLPRRSTVPFTGGEMGTGAETRKSVVGKRLCTRDDGGRYDKHANSTKYFPRSVSKFWHTP